MKKKLFKISLITLGVFIIFMLFNIVTLKAAEAEDPYNSSLGLKETITKYHEFVNDTFNEYTKKMITTKYPEDPNGKPLANAEECVANKENYSTFCLATRLIGGSGTPGYIEYKNSLLRRKQEIFDSEQEKGNLRKIKDQIYDATTAVTNFVCKDINIDREIVVAKKALDQALSAYDQLRLAWPMHQQYQNILDSLVTYRDKLVEVREETDVFPARFVDVSTAKCF